MPLFLAGTTPKYVEMDFVYGDNDIVAAKACRYRMKTKPRNIKDGFTDEWMNNYELFLS